MDDCKQNNKRHENHVFLKEFRSDMEMQIIGELPTRENKDSIFF